MPENFFRRDDLCYEFQILDALADGDAHLMCIDHSGERLSAALPTICLGEKIIVLREQYPPEFRRAVEERRIFEFVRSVFVSCEHIHATRPKAVRDRLRNIVIHTKRETSATPSSLYSLGEIDGVHLPAKLLDALVPPLDVAVEFFAVVVVIRERGMDLPEREMRMLEMKLLGTPPVRPPLDDEIHDLHLRSDNARNPILVHFDMFIASLHER